MKHLKCFAHILLAWLALAPLRPTLAQSTAVVPNVVMRALQEEVNLSRETRTGADGVYEFRILPPGAYTVSAELNQGAPGRFAGPRSIVLRAQVQW